MATSTKKAKEETKKTRAPRKAIPKVVYPEIIIGNDYKVKTSKYSYDLYRKYDKSTDATEDVLEDEEVETGWTCLGHFGLNSWNCIRKQIFNDMTLRKMTKLKELDLEKYASLCEKITKEIEKLFTNNEEILLNSKNKKEK